MFDSVRLPTITVLIHLCVSIFLYPTYENINIIIRLHNRDDTSEIPQSGSLYGIWDYYKWSGSNRSGKIN